jgi:ATP-dependent Clp protease ATP-binding subunit ClpB
MSSSFLRIDMSEYMERFSVSRLIGAPPGYVGYEEGGVLTDAVRRRPYQLILLDEFEKAHREVSNLLLQVFDEGRLTDSQGRVVDFRNTVIIMTSNLGSDVLGKLKKDSSAVTESKDEKAQDSESDVSAETENELTKKLENLSRSDVATKIVHQHFSPEFVNRLDEVVVFNPLTDEALMKICQIQLVKVKQLLHEKKIDFHISETAAMAVTKRGTDLTYGARPLKRFIQNDIMSPLANLILDVSLNVRVSDSFMVLTITFYFQGTITKNDRVFMSTTGHSLSYVEELVPDLRATKVTTIAANNHGGSKSSGKDNDLIS